MKILFGIIFFHFMVISFAKNTAYKETTYTAAFILSAFLVIYVVFMMFSMPVPEP